MSKKIARKVGYKQDLTRYFGKVYVTLEKSLCHSISFKDHECIDQYLGLLEEHIKYFTVLTLLK